MYSREKRMKAIELYIKYDKSVADVIHELGYPSRNLLPRWYKAYLEEQETGVLRDRYSRCPKYSLEQKAAALEHYLENGRNLLRTIKALGYPSRETLGAWCKELAPKTRISRTGGLQYTQEQKKESIFSLCARTGSAKAVAKKYGVTRAALYKWKGDLLGKGASALVREKDQPLPDDRDALLSEVELLKRQIHRLKLEKDMLEGTVEIVKKDPGVDPKNLTNREKAVLVDTRRNEYPLQELLDFLGMARSSYFYHRNTAMRFTMLFEENDGRYGYRMVHGLLARTGTRISEKIVQQIMAEKHLVVISKKKRKYNSYQRENNPSGPNVIELDFHANAPNVK